MKMMFYLHETVKVVQDGGIEEREKCAQDNNSNTFDRSTTFILVSLQDNCSHQLACTLTAHRADHHYHVW